MTATGQLFSIGIAFVICYVGLCALIALVMLVIKLVTGEWPDL